ncbi:hypothetical protein [Sediminibacillus massiliensis]|uniref:hypothetical protein n=1 Tax=Sediminibacillus massiliensis TaxID=1926277 RepID=UPI0009884D99|nr:hypothetical protein [Sediminibacillus massiliensis]
MLYNGKFTFGCLFSAILIGILGQDIAYFLYDHLAKVNPASYLAVLYTCSFLLFLLSVVSALVQVRYRKIKKETISLYLLVIFTIGVPATVWSLFVMAVWLG